MRPILFHLWCFRDHRYLRWRLETFGMYAPSLPYERPWWQISRVALIAFLRAFSGYIHWVKRMQLLSGAGPEAIWNELVPRRTLARWRAWQLKQQVEE